MSRLPPASSISFTKPWLDYAGQLALLESRGLVVGNGADRTAAEEFLAHVNYYRLSFYCPAFEQSRHCFRPGTTFAQVRGAYEFDRCLRDLLSDALQVIEVDIRTAAAYHLGHVYGAYGHTDPTSFFPGFNHADWIVRVRGEIERSREEFVEHFRITYTRYPDLPIWATTEAISFGILSRMLSGLKDNDARPIASRYRLKPRTFGSWVHHLSYLRNLCAHHSRVWDRYWSIAPQLPNLPEWQLPYIRGNGRLACSLMILYRMLLGCRAVGGYPVEWRDRVNDLLATPPDAPNATTLMGILQPLTSNPLWT